METLARKIALLCGRTVFTVSLAACLTLPSCAPERAAPKVPFYSDATFTPQWEAPAQKDDHRIPAFRFTDQHGKAFGSREVAGHIYLANFFFTTCKSICPKMLGNMQAVQRHFKDNAQVLYLSHSVTPEIDSVARLKQYALDNGIVTPQWHLLTGSAPEIYNMARGEYFVEEGGLNKDANEFLHTENMVLVDGKGRIRGLYNGTLATEVPRMIADIDILLQEQ